MERSRLPLASVSDRAAEFSPTDTQWKRIERAYGHAFSKTARQAIREATTNFARFEPFERAAEPVSLARKRVLAVQKAAKAFHDALVTAPTTTANVYAHFLIKRHFADETLWSRKLRGQKEDKLVRLRRLPALLRDACTSALAELDNLSLPGHREGDCWRGWMQNLTRIAKEHGLPTAARTDTDKIAGDRPSPFVALVRELQRLVPTAAARHAHSNDALAKAIQRARRGRGASVASQTILADLANLSDKALFRYAMR
jgi:hypothetical protein